MHLDPSPSTVVFVLSNSQIQDIPSHKELYSRARNHEPVASSFGRTMDSSKFHNALLRPAVLQILRAAGFQSARPFAIDALTDIAGLYIRQLAECTADHATNNHNDPVPDVTDVRLAMADCAVFAPLSTPAEEAWRELMRKPLDQFHENVRAQEQARRDEEDTKEVKDFVDWVRGDANKEISRIAGLLPDESTGNTADLPDLKEDYLIGMSAASQMPFARINLINSALKKKHSKTGEESRFQGTILGIQAEDRTIKVEGGPVDSVEAWNERARRRSSKLATIQSGNDTIPEAIEEDTIMAEG